MQSNYQPPFQDAKDQLRKWREQNERKSEEVIELWSKVVGSKSKKLGDERWMVLEQVALASLDVHNYEIAEDTLLELKQRFPESDRVRFLQILRMQALQRYDEALTGLDKMIQRDNTNSQAYKQRITVLKCQGKNQTAIKELTEYLNKFMSDQEAWSELCDMYLAEGDYNRAAFCAEELILHNPHSYFVHLRLADIRYTQGGIENVKMASSYFSQALKLNPECMRALFGVFLSSSQLATNPRMAAGDKKEYVKIANWAAEEVKSRYGELPKGKGSSDELFMDLLGALQLQ